MKVAGRSRSTLAFRRVWVWGRWGLGLGVRGSRDPQGSPVKHPRGRGGGGRGGINIHSQNMLIFCTHAHMLHTTPDTLKCRRGPHSKFDC